MSKTAPVTKSNWRGPHTLLVPICIYRYATVFEEMCKAPNTLHDGTQVACRECSLCQERAKNDWIGRNIAESKTAKFSYVLTLTYGRGRVGEVLHERAVILTYSDVRKFIMLLRRHGFKVRQFITGEYGSERGRAHWNVILYSDDPIPQLAGWDQYGRWTGEAYYTQRFNWVRTNARGEAVYLQNGQPAFWWPHGFVHVDVVNMKNIRYVCKYVLKDLDSNGKQGYKGQCRNPPLGAKYFEQLAEKYVAQGLAPQSPEYRFPEAKRRNGEVVPFWLKARSLELFLDHFIAKWDEQRPDQPRPGSDLVDLYIDHGRVVFNENRFFERRDNPSGRPYAPAPTKDEIAQEKAAAERMRAEKAAYRRMDADDRWHYKWIEGAMNEQERQRRQEITECGEEARSQKLWRDEWHKRGFIGVPGVGWKKPDPGEQCACKDCAPERIDDSTDVRPQTGVAGEGSPPLGKVGKWNANYPRETGANAFGSGSADRS